MAFEVQAIAHGPKAFSPENVIFLSRFVLVELAINCQLKSKFAGSPTVLDI